MEVIVAENSGFCHGVRNAIDVAEKTLTSEKNVYSLGPIIHNNDEVDRLTKAGLKNVQTIDQIPSGTVIIRSHGAAPKQIEALRTKGLKIVDATCVLVKRVQQLAQQLAEDGYLIVIIGDENHPEVQAVMGSAENVVVVSDESDMRKLSYNNKLGIVCQTTQSPEYFRQIVCAIIGQDFHELRILNTLCKEAIKRQKSAVELCKKVDIMFVLGGLHSANTHRLAELCKKYNNQTFHLQNWSEFDKSILFGKRSAGVTAGASTPDWVISEFVENLRAFNSKASDES